MSILKWRDWVFANRHRGELVARINGKRRRMRLSFAALAQLESCYGDTDILTLLARFNGDGLSAVDADNILRAGLAATDDALCRSGGPLDVADDDETAEVLARRLLRIAFAENAIPKTAPPRPSNGH